MRPIKFRAWDKINAKMWDVLQYLPYAGKNWTVKIQHEWWSSYMTDEFDLMQFTWLLDKNGKEIYAGDILEFDGNKEIYWEVVFDIFRWMWMKDWKNKDQDLYEQLWNNQISQWVIIGNKFNI